MATIIHHVRRFKHHLYTVHIHGVHVTVTVTASASVVKRWLSSTLYFRRRYAYLNRLVVGLGVQWTPGGSNPPADTLQLCIGRRCLVFQLARADHVPTCLRTFLNHPFHTFVGFWNHSDRRKLESSEHCLEMWRDPLDLRLWAETVDDDDDESLARASVEVIIEKCLDYEVEQRSEISMSDWDRKYLSHDQVVYATVDAHCAFLIGRNSRLWKLQIQEV
ncbi:Werner Syndrome-like exonuclease [Cajanus cajan]|nr:Werner Syndrome-like exonuclease [Cajanus cajan]